MQFPKIPGKKKLEEKKNLLYFPNEKTLKL